MKSILSSLPMIVLGSALTAADLSIERTYSLYDPVFKAVDATCIHAFSTEMVPGFEGLTGLVLESFDFFQTETGAIGVQSDVEFQSEHLDATGDIICSFAPDGKVTDVIARFDGKGLGGFKRRGYSSPSSDPADWTVTATQSTVGK